MLTLRTSRGSAERAAFIGVTRSGKTTLMRELAGALQSVVVMDSKQHPGDWIEWAAAHGWAVTRDPAAIRRYPRVVHLVDSRSIQDRAGWEKPGRLGFAWTEALGSCFYRAVGEGASTLVIFDEGMHTMALNPHPDARRLATQGAALGLPVWIGTQAPNWIDTVALAQVEHVLAWSMQNVEHRKVLEKRRGLPCAVLAELAGPDDPRAARRHEFAHHQVGSDHWEPFAPIEFRTTRTVRERAAPPPPPDNVRLTGSPAAV